MDSNTMDPSGVHSIDKDKLKAYLVKTVGIGKYTDELNIKQYNKGQSNPTYYVKLGKNEMVLRKKPPGKLLRGAHQVNREYRVMKAIYDTGFPVPRMFYHCSHPEVLGTEFFIMQFMPGRVLTSTMPGVSSRDRWDCLLHATKTLAQLHKIDPVSIGLQDYGKSKGFCERVVNTWTKQYNASADKHIPEMDRLIVWLRNKLPHIQDETTIVHGDYSLSNVMFHPTQSKVIAVLDWELSTLGHPLMDFSYLCMPYHSPPEYFASQQATGDDIKQLFDDLPPEEEVVKYYCKLRGIPYPIPNWNFYLALNFFKLAAIVQGVYARSLQGNASSPFASLYGSLVTPLLRTALKLAESFLLEGNRHR